MESAETSLPQTRRPYKGDFKPVRPPLPLKPKGPPATAPKAEEKPKIVEPDTTLWARAYSNRTPVKIRLLTGDVLTGPVKGFGRYSVAIETSNDGVVVVFKTAMVTAAEVAQ